MQQLLERLDDQLATALHDLDAVQVQSRPRTHPEKWTIQQIAEHLLLTYQSTSNLLRTRLAKGTPTQAKPSWQQRAAQWIMLTLGFVPPGREAPAAVTPSLSVPFLTGQELVQRIRHGLSEMDALATATEEAFGKGRCASHFILGPLSAYQWRRFHLVHGRHHIRQIHRIRREHAI